MSDPHALADCLRELTDSIEAGDGYGDLPLGWVGTLTVLRGAANLIELLDDCLRTHHEEEPVLPCPICTVVRGHHRDEE